MYGILEDIRAWRLEQGRGALEAKLRMEGRRKEQDNHGLRRDGQQYLNYHAMHISLNQVIPVTPSANIFFRL